MIDVSGHLRNIRREEGFKDHSRDIIVNCAGYQRLDGMDFERQRPLGREDFQILLITRGKGEFLFDDSQWVSIGEGEIVLYRPGEPQLYRYSGRIETEVHWIHFTGFRALLYLQDHGLDAPRIQRIGISGEMIALFREIMTELQIRKPGFQQMARGKFFQLLAQMERQKIERLTARPHPAIDTAVAYIHRHYNTSLDLDELAEQCALSKHRFCHLFSRHMGSAPIEYAINLRIESAKELLQTTAYNIRGIAELVGYDNPFYFSRIFTKRTGVSPREWRRSHTVPATPATEA